MLLFAFAFVSGLVTILAPCIWPLLPIVLSTSNGSHKKSLGITVGIMLSFALFTLSISYIVSLFHIDPNIFRILAVIVISLLGISLIIPSFITILEGGVSKISSRFAGATTHGSGFVGGLITGLSLGIVWSPCAGPILATIATLAATRSVSTQLVLVTGSYVIGVGVPLFIFSYAGGYFINRSRFVSAYTGRIQQIFGVIMILTAIAIVTNYDKTVQVKLLDLFPSYSSLLTQFETSKTVQQQLNTLKGKKQDLQNSSLPSLGNAPDFTTGGAWFNSQPLHITDLKGKVVLVDFWTYTCINCIRTLPHVISWYEKYKDKGFVVVGVHTPEFEFEKNANNVASAIKQYGITYPVMQDNNYTTWGAYNNEYWPAKYLIDKNGIVRYTHFGEGEYDTTEKVIAQLLGEEMVTSHNIIDETPTSGLTQETYLGTRRLQYLYPDGSSSNGLHDFKTSANIPQNYFSFGGTWDLTDEYAQSVTTSTIDFTVTASKVFLVLRPGSSTEGRIKVLLDGKVVDSSNAGADVQNGTVTVTTDRLYNLIDLKGTVGTYHLRLEFNTAGIQAFAFTFG